MNKTISLLALLSVASQGCNVSTGIQCFPGERLHNPLRASDGEEEVCITCDNGTFMPERDHRRRSCYNCSKIENPKTETMITPCNRTHDAEIGCISGYYRLKEESMPGRSPSLRRCMPCPEDTYMQAHNHTHTECFKCETLSANTSNHATILQPCSRASPTIFGCEKFHFRVSNSQSLLVETPCKPCQTCQIEVQKCDIFHDAVCAKGGQHEDDYTYKEEEPDFIAMSDSISDNCVNQCTKDFCEIAKASVAETESSRRKCWKNCYPEIDKENMVPDWSPEIYPVCEIIVRVNKPISSIALLPMFSHRCDVFNGISCFPGERLHNPLRPFDMEVEVCIPCDNGTFMPERDHIIRSCYKCSSIENSKTETLITPCNRTHDAEIGCISGYYRLKEESMPGRGPSLRRCMPCPENTYMQAHNHTNRECFKCETLSAKTSNHATILQPCSRRSPTIFGCEKFHFRVNNSQSLLEEAPCKPCQTCQIEVEKCDIFNDAVCTKERHQLDSSTHGETEADCTASPESILDSCVRQCTKDLFETTNASVFQSESSRRTCLKDCYPEIEKENTVPVWILAVFFIVLLLLLIVINYYVFCLPAISATCYFRNVVLNRSQVKIIYFYLVSSISVCLLLVLCLALL